MVPGWARRASDEEILLIILGLNAFHGDAAACLVRDGELVAAVEEERFRRVKHWAGFPTESIRYCLREARVDLAQVDHLAMNSNPRANLGRRLAYAAFRWPDPRLVLDRIRNQHRRSSISAELSAAFPGELFHGAVHRIEHHFAHLASAFLVSPFEKAAVVSIDGFGDFSSTAWGVGRGGDIEVEGRVSFPHSLGVFYQAITQYLGFPHYGDEYKVMGLAPYGEPRYLEAMRRIVRIGANGAFKLDLAFFRHHDEKIAYEWSGGAPSVGTLYSPTLESLLGPARRTEEPLTERHHDIARSAQAMYEEAFFNLLNTIHRRHGPTSVALAGGCAMNSVANGKIRRSTPFRKVYVQAAAGDAGGAIGAAFAARSKLGGKRAFVMSHAYWGPQYSEEDNERVLIANRDRIDSARCVISRVADERELCRQTARAIANGWVVGWFQGRMEWGPRALGNRSILCDPRRGDMKQILNSKIKRRESFRPFAPSVLAEAVADWFEEDDDAPFMMQVFQVRAEKRARIPAVTHVDGSGRLQTVRRAANPRYHALISAFHEIAGVPMVLNTSFNENEPIVCKPEEALDCFLRTEMDMLILGGLMMSRRSSIENQTTSAATETASG